MQNIKAMASTVTIAVLLIWSGEAAATTTAHAMTVAGEASGANCGSWGPQPLTHTFFNAGAGLPSGGYGGCQLAGSIDDHQSSGATVASSDAAADFNNGSAIVAASAHAYYDRIGTEASATYTGYQNGIFTAHDADAAAIIDDVIPTGSIAAGSTITLGFTIDGALTASSNSFATTQFTYRGTDGILYSGLYAALNHGSTFLNAGNGSDLTGFVQSGDTLAGTATIFTYAMPIMGDMFDLNYGLYSYADAGPFTGEAASEFASTARLTSIVVRDASGNVIDFSAISASGTLYDAQGAHVQVAGVPEPATWAMMVAGFGIAGVGLRSSRDRARDQRARALV